MNFAKKMMLQKNLQAIRGANLACVEVMTFLADKYQMNEEEREQLDRFELHLKNMNKLFSNMLK